MTRLTGRSMVNLSPLVTTSAFGRDVYRVHMASALWI